MKPRTWIGPATLALLAVLAVSGCAKKEDTTATGGAADSLAAKNQQTPLAGSADSAAKVSERERNGQPLPTGAPPAPAADHGKAKAHKAEPPSGGHTGATRAPGFKVTYATVPQGQSGEMTLTTALSSETSKEGDTFTAELATGWMEDNKLVLPAGTRVLGHVGYAEAAARGKTKAKLVLVYDKLGLSSGETVDIDAKPDSFEASGTTKRDVAVTGAGALIGGLLGKLSGNTKKGVVIGGVVGAGAAVGARGNAMELPAGQKLTLRIQQDVKVPVKKGGA